MRTYVRTPVFGLPLVNPTDVVADQANADFEDGILTISLPKAEEVRLKTITVKAK